MATTPEDESSLVLTIDPLPLELVIKIFEIAALDSRKTCLTLCLVSITARAAVLPILLGTIVVSDRESATAFHQYVSNDITLRPRMPAGHTHHSKLVKKLWMDDPEAMTVPSAEAETRLVDTLMRCESVDDLAVTTRCLWTLTNPSAAATTQAIVAQATDGQPPPRHAHRKLRMDVLPSTTPSDINALEDADDAQMTATVLHAITAAPTWPFPLFSATTHLYLHIKLSAPTLLFSAFPHLSHLALPLVTTLTLLTENLDALVRAPSLARLAVTISPREYLDMGKRLMEWTCQAREVDSRVSTVVVGDDDIEERWRDSCDIWECAEPREWVNA